MRTRFRKVLKDFLSNGSRTILVVLAIFAGVFGTGLVLNLYGMVRREMNASFMETNPHSFRIGVSGADENMLTELTAMEGVEDAEIRRTVRARTGSGEDAWLSSTAYLHVIEDFNNMRIDTFQGADGKKSTETLVPQFGEVLLERESVTDCGIGDTIRVKISQNEEQNLYVAGKVHAPGLEPAWMENAVYGFISPETLDLLGTPLEDCHLLFVVSESIRFDEAAVRAVAFQIRDWLTENGCSVKSVMVPTPGKHPHGDQTNALMFLFQVFGILSLALSGVLVVNMISSMLSGQVRQIAMMKATGARRGQVAGMYYLLVVLSGAIALAFAMPLAAAGARAMLDVCASMLNFAVASYGIPWWSYLLQAAAALLIPAAAASYPIARGAGLSVSEGLRDYGTGKTRFGDARFERWLGKVRLPSPVLLSLRNTFRRRGRLFTTVATLAVGGATLIVSLNINASIGNTLDQAMSVLPYDIQYTFSAAYPEEDVTAAIDRVPGVRKIETGTATTVSTVYPDGVESNPFQLVAVDCQSETPHPPVVSGRWLEPDDINAVVLNHIYADSEAGIKVGDAVTLKSHGISGSWVVAGIVREVGAGAKAYVCSDAYRRLFAQEGSVRAVNIVAEERTTDTLRLMETQLEKSFREAGIDVMASGNFEDTRMMLDNHLAIIVGFLLAASALVILVGAMGLVSSTSINLMERRRETGVMRSCGATFRNLLFVAVFEGAFICLLSCAVSAAISLPLTHLVGNGFGRIFLQTPLDNVLNPFGYMLWLCAVLAITSLVGLGMTLKVLEIPVNEVLNYE